LVFAFYLKFSLELPFSPVYDKFEHIPEEFMIILTRPTSIKQQSNGKFTLLFDLDFSLDTHYQIDLSGLKNSNTGVVQVDVHALILNNINNTNPVSLNFEEVVYNNVFPAGGTLAVEVPPTINPRYIFLSSGAQSGTAILYVCGYPLLSASASSLQGSQTLLQEIENNTAGTVTNLSQQQNADNLVPASSLFALVGGYFYLPGTGWIRNRMGGNPLAYDIVKPSAGNSAILDANVRIFSLELSLSNNAIQAAAGQNLIQILDGTNPIVKANPAIPTTASSGFGSTRIARVVFKNGYVMNGGSLNLNLQNALTGGAVSVNGEYGPI
jgi:hypothetical protein